MTYRLAEFGHVPIDWEIIKLEQHLTLLTDYHANGSYKVLKENVELLDFKDYAIMIRATNFEQDSFNEKDFKYISKKAYDFLSKSKVKSNDVLMNKIGNAGNVYLMPSLGQPVSLAMNLFLLRFNEEKINQKYVYFFLKNNEQYVKTRAAGTVTQTITKNNVRNLQLAIPSLTEQNLIVDTLSALDNKIELNNKINENLEQEAQAIFKHWFIDFEFPDENGNPYKSSGGKMVESELGMIPKGWKVAKLKDISERENGYSYRSVDMNEESNNKLLTLKNFNRNGGYDNSHYRRIDITDRVREHHYVKDGNILLACTDLTQNGEVVGNAIRYFSTDKFDNALMSMDLVKIVPKDLKDNLYIYYLLKNRNFKEYAKNHSTGTTVLHFKKSSIDDFRIVKPRKEIINSFTDIIQNIEKKIINNYNQNQKLSQLRDTLLPKLMSGELRIPLD